MRSEPSSSLTGPRLSVAMIVRDEAARLLTALDSVKAIADEVIVVDTGSTDETVAIAQAAGAQVGTFAWTDDFAAARNAALDACTGAWILILDADEALSPVGLDTLREIVAIDPLWPTACEVVIRNWTNEAEGTGFDHRAVRLLSRDAALRFVGCVHEQVTHLQEGEAGIEWLLAPEVLIDHWGYLPEARRAKGKSDRNRRLLTQMVADRPQDPSAHHHLGVWHWAERRPDEALAAFEQALALSGGDDPAPAYLRATHTLRVASQVALSRFTDALEAAGEAAAACEGEPDYWFNVGLAQQGLGEHEAAVATFLRCLDLRGTVPYMAEHGTRGWKAGLAMATSFDALDRRDAAMVARWDSLRDFPVQPVLHGKLWAQALLDRNAEANTEAHRIWQAGAPAQQGRVAAVAVETLAGVSAWQAAERLSVELFAQLPEGSRGPLAVLLAGLFERRGAAMERFALLMASQQEPGVGWLLAQDQQRHGDWSGFERTCRRLVESGEQVAEAAAGLGMALLRAGDGVAADSALKLALQHGSNDANVWNNLGVIALGRRQVDEAEQHFLHATMVRQDHVSAYLNLVRTSWYFQEPTKATARLATVMALMDGLFAQGPGPHLLAAIQELEALHGYFRGWDMRRQRDPHLVGPEGTDAFIAAVYRSWQVVGRRLAALQESQP
jgi:tetratricopeptide (TPR) repeat protein